MVAPSGEGAERCMRMALANVKSKIDYINPHATLDAGGRSAGNRGAAQRCSAARNKCPPISATKSLTGHSLGATGVQEAIYSLLMMNNGFICESANITELDPVFADMPIVRKRIDKRQARDRAVEFIRLRRHQRDAGVQADGCVIFLITSPRSSRGEVGGQRQLRAG